MSTTITTNNQSREFKCFEDFTPRQQQQLKKDYNWLDNIETDCFFFTYRRRVFHLNEFTNIIPAPHEALYGWHGMCGDNWFSGHVVRVNPCDNTVTVGRYSS